MIVSFLRSLECRAKDHPNHFGVAKWLQLIIEFCYFWLSSQLLHRSNIFAAQLPFMEKTEGLYQPFHSLMLLLKKNHLCQDVVWGGRRENGGEARSRNKKPNLYYMHSLHTSYGPLILSNNSWMYSPGLVCKCTQNFCQPGAFIFILSQCRNCSYITFFSSELGRTKETLQNQETSMKGIQKWIMGREEHLF